MSEFLRKLHNLALNCESMDEFFDYAFLLQVSTNLNLDKSSSLIDGSLLAGECTILPMYYFRASTASGMKQDRHGKFYKS